MSRGGSQSQDTTGSIEGVVLDASQERLPGAVVVAKGPEQFKRITDSDGRFRMLLLPLGQYEVSARLVGFATEVIKGVEVRLGETANLRFTLSLSDSGEE